VVSSNALRSVRYCTLDSAEPPAAVTRFAFAAEPLDALDGPQGELMAALRCGTLGAPEVAEDRRIGGGQDVVGPAGPVPPDVPVGGLWRLWERQTDHPEVLLDDGHCTRNGAIAGVGSEYELDAPAIERLIERALFGVGQSVKRIDADFDRAHRYHATGG
jgi:hypothetical protein